MNYFLIFLFFITGISIGILIKRFRTKVFKGPRSSLIRRKIHYDDEGNSYRFEPVIHVCPPNINADEFSHSDDSEED